MKDMGTRKSVTPSLLQNSNMVNYRNKTIMLYNLGDTVFDCTIIRFDVNGQGQVLAKNGDSTLGVTACDNMFAFILWRKYAARTKNPPSTLTAADFRTNQACSNIKLRLINEFRALSREIRHGLSVRLSHKVSLDNGQLALTVGKAEFEECIIPSLQATLNIVRDTIADAFLFSESEVDEVLLTGEASTMPYVKAMLECIDCWVRNVTPCNPGMLACINRALTTHRTSPHYTYPHATGMVSSHATNIVWNTSKVLECLMKMVFANGTIPQLEGLGLSCDQVAEIAYQTIVIDKTIPSASAREWLEWKQTLIRYNAKHGDLWDGFLKTSISKNGDPLIIYRLFLFTSGITHSTKFDPTRLLDAALPRSDASTYIRFKTAVSKDATLLDSDIRAQIWRGFRQERDLRYLAADVPKPRCEPHSSATMLEMFECYFDCREYTYAYREFCDEAIKSLKIAKAIVTRYWHMIGSLAIGQIIYSNFLLGFSALATLLFLWHKQRNSTTSPLYTIPHWDPQSTTIYVALCYFVDTTPWLALITAIPVSVFAAHLGRKWDEIKAAA